MAAPRCTRSLFGSARRVQISAPSRPCTQAFSRAKSSKGVDDADRDFRGDAKGLPEDMALDERLTEMGIDPAKYKELWRSQQKIQRDFKKWEPKTAAEAAQRWEEAKNAPDHYTMLQMFKHIGVEPIKLAKERGIELPGGEKPSLDSKTEQQLEDLRTPINVQAVNLRPLRRAAPHGVPVCDLQLRTYSVRNLLLFADFAMRVAYYMGLPAKGPIPLPRITERWTVPRSNFIFKKSQENFERITMRRLIQIQDGHPETVKAWLAFLQKHQYWGIGMKANMWEYESLDAATGVGAEIKPGEYTGRRERAMLEKVEEILQGPGYAEAMKGYKKPAELRP